MEAEWRDLDNSSCWTLGRQGPPTGLTAIVSDTAGQREVAEQAPDAVLLWPSGDASALAVHMLRCSADQRPCSAQGPLRCKQRKDYSAGSAKKKCCWRRSRARCTGRLPIIWFDEQSRRIALMARQANEVDSGSREREAKPIPHIISSATAAK